MTRQWTEMGSGATPAQPTEAHGAEVAWALLALVAWFFLTIRLGFGDALGAPGRPPVGLGAAIAVPLLLFALDARRGGPFSRAFSRLDLQTLTALQTFRVGGGMFFLVAWMQGRLPAGFALPAGLGDVAIGIAAPFVAAAIAARTHRHRLLALAWNVAGLVDLVSALFLGVTHARSAFGLFAGTVTTDRLGHYPFNLIPTFLVPLALLLHVLSLRAIAAGARAGRPASR